MITKTTTYTRSDVSIDFPPMASKDLQLHINATYKGNPAKLISTTRQLSEDLLTLTITQVFESQAAMDEFDNDPLRSDFKATRDAYIQANNIASSQTVA